MAADLCKSFRHVAYGSNTLLTCGISRSVSQQTNQPSNTHFYTAPHLDTASPSSTWRGSGSRQNWMEKCGLRPIFHCEWQGIWQVKSYVASESGA